MIIEIDPHAGFCFGVKEAIEKAEVELVNAESLLCLGEIVHNREETRRLEGQGLKTIDRDQFRELKNAKVLIRAHGEPPETYETARKNNITLVEATCPIVLKLQKRVHDAWLEMKEKGGLVIIAGKRNHPEVLGLEGQADHHAIVVESMDELKKIQLDKPVRMFAQTTFDREEYDRMKAWASDILDHDGQKEKKFKSYHSICGQVSNRVPKLKSFCSIHDVIIFVSGKNSSNGKNLFDHCKAVNPRSYFVSTPEELDEQWIRDAKSIGISGATSTPRWLMENIAEKISEL